MKIYLAGLYTSNFGTSESAYSKLTDVEKHWRNTVAYYLESYHYIHKETFVKKIRKDNVRVFLDSGAFSAFTKGVKVDLPRYCNWIKEHEDFIDFASVLDSIGDAQGTFENQVAMEKLGVTPLPCFHYGEDLRYLEYYVDNYEYITLGGMVPISSPQLVLWLDDLWQNYLTDSNGHPKLKVHGFGLTSVPLMERYPWYSVDSSSWVQIAANGGIFHPDVGVIAISDRSPARKMAGQHYDTLPKIQQEALKLKIEESGYEVERLRTVYQARWSYNCWSFTELSRRYSEGEPTFIRDQIGLF